MASGSTLWRRLAGVLAILALALVMFGAPAQAAPCADDLAVASAAAEAPALVSAETPADPCDEGCCPCVCCHAHPAAAAAPEGAALAAPSQAAAGHAQASVPAPASNATSGLLRPPRA